jgi:hypothetical protein
MTTDLYITNVDGTGTATVPKVSDASDPARQPEAAP